MSAVALPLQLRGVIWEAGGQRRLDGIDLSIEAGPRTIILGPNGAGKSLLLRLCHGLLQPSAGRIDWRGPAAAEAAGHQAMVFQRPVMLRRSALANVAYGLKLAGVERGERQVRALRAMTSRH